MRTTTALMAGAALLAGCSSVTEPGGQVIGSGHVVTEARPVSDVAVVSISGVGRLIVEPGRPSLTVTAEDNILPLLVTDVRGGRLMIGTAPGASISPTQEIVYELTVSELQAIEVSGAGVVHAVGINTDVLRVGISGAGMVFVEGVAGFQDAGISGAGAYRADLMWTAEAAVGVSGAGRALVRVSELLDANVSGAGLVEYIGTPLVRAQVSGTGLVRQVGVR